MRGVLLAALLLHTLSLSTPGPLAQLRPAPDGKRRCVPLRLGESGAGLGMGSGALLSATLRLKGGGSRARTPSTARSPSRGGGATSQGGSATPRGKSSGGGNRKASQGESSEDDSMGVGGSLEDPPKRAATSPQKNASPNIKPHRPEQSSPKTAGKMGSPSGKDGGAAASPRKGKVLSGFVGASPEEGGAGGAVVEDSSASGARRKRGKGGRDGAGVRDSARTLDEKRIATEVKRVPTCKLGRRLSRFSRVLALPQITWLLLEYRQIIFELERWYGARI